jgi:hypothetical protein
MPAPKAKPDRSRPAGPQDTRPRQLRQVTESSRRLIAQTLPAAESVRLAEGSLDVQVGSYVRLRRYISLPPALEWSVVAG